MKKLTGLLLSLMLVLSCGLFVACGPKTQASITLSTNSVSIFLGETENNSVVVNALPKDVDVKLLDVIYDTTYIKITQSEKLADGSFNLTVISKVADFGTTTPIAVQVNAGDASAVFYVELVLPVTGILAKADTHIAYNGARTTLNLLDCITFEPAGTKQTGVEFALSQELSYAHIEGNYLVVDAGAEVNFVGGEIPSVKVLVNSTVEGKSSIGTEFNVDIVPNIKLLADIIDVKLNYNGADNLALENIDYNLSITKNEGTGNYQISPFVVTIAIPTTLGVEVDVDTQTGGGLSTNILNYLTYAKSISQDRTNPANILDVYTFTFEANSTLQGEGYLRFNYKYSDYYDDNGLSASFVGVATDETLLDKLNVSVVMPITSINVSTDSTLNASDQYIIYQNYESGIYGSSFAFVAMPVGTVQTDLVLVKSETCSLTLFNSRGQLLNFEYNEETLRLECPIQSNETIYVKGGANAVETLKCYSLTPGKEGIVKEIALNVLEGGSGLGFVDSFDDATGVESKTIYMQQNVPAEVLVYSPGALLVDFVYNTNNVIVSNTEKTGYFKLTFKDLTVGEHILTISTVNGYSVQAIVKVIEPITSVNVVLGDNASHISGVGDFEIYNGDIINVALENGYSALLNYVTNKDAEVLRVEYSFYEPNINVYDTKIKDLKTVYAENYLELNGIGEFDFVEASNYISTQNLNVNNLLTATATGIVIIKINIYGQNVENNNVKEEIVATKYLFVEVYNPVKKIESSAKNISLRADNELDEDYKYMSSTVINTSIISNNGLTATYDKLFIDAGLYSVEPGAEGEDDIVTSKFVKRVSGKQIFEAVYNFATKQITINVFYVDSSIAGTIHSITLIAGDFVNIASGKTVFIDDLKDYNLKTYTINLTILQTSVVEDITVSNLTLESETQTTYNQDGSIATLGEKTYNTVYIDTSKSSTVIYKIYTEVSPSSAFNKNLVYTFNPNSGYSQAMIDIANDGTVTVLSNQGGTGVITIRPADSHSNARLVRIPIVVADGNSWETAYEISSLSEVIYTNKHYVLTNPTIYLSNNTILKDAIFNGGLYGVRYSEKDTATAYATIRLTGEPLFTMLGQNAKLHCLNICGDVNSKDQSIAVSETETVEYNNGFIAFANKGLISDVKVTTYVNANGIYVPSTLYVNSDIAFVGGLVGENSGTISNCTFAGSINITNALADVKANAIAGINNNKVENCTVVIAKFGSDVSLDRVVADTDNDRKNKTETYYVNGVVDVRDGSRRTNSLFDDIDGTKITKKRYDGDMYVLDKNLFIRNNTGHSYGEPNSLYGIVFYYKALYERKQSLIADLNTISFEKLFDFANLGNDENAKAQVAKQLKVSALNIDGVTVCNYVNVGANTIEINGVGEFIIKITSEYDYTLVFEIRLLSVYYASEFGVSYNGSKLTNADKLEIVYDQTREIVSNLNNNVTYKGNSVELYSNDFAIVFDLVYGGTKIENPSVYITNNKLGMHTINMKFGWDEETQVYAMLDTGFGIEYNNMLNKLYGLTAEGNPVHLFNIQRKFGTTEIKTNVTDGEMEPSDIFAFEATLTTDLAEDYIAKLDNSGLIKGIEIFNQTNYDCTNLFNINVNKIDANLDGVVDVSDFTYNIQVSLNLDAFYGENPVDIMNYINKKYTILVYAMNTAGSDTYRYQAFASVSFKLLPQTISNINTALYNITSSTVAGVNVSEREISTSVLMPSESGLFTIDMFPSYASFDYLEMIATSNTMAKLNYRLEEYDPSVLTAEDDDTIDWIANYRTVVSNVDADGNKIYEATSDKNGIRIYNNDSYNLEFYQKYAEKYSSRPHLNNINNIGKYFIKIFADSSFDTDTIFTITVNAYLNGQVLTASSSFTLYMRMPEAPQLTIDGQTKVYKLVGEEIIADVLVSDDQIDFYPYLASYGEGSEQISVLDNKSLSNINVSYWQVSENSVVGYKRYKIAIGFTDEYNPSSQDDSTQLKLVVETTKIFNGKSIKVSSDVYIYMVDFLPQENDIQIFGSIDGIFNVTSLKETELKLADLLPNNVNATAEFIEQFNTNYYYPVLGEGALESATGFTFGKNTFTVNVGKEVYTHANKAYVLASYLSYVKDNSKTSLLSYYFDNNGNLVVNHNKDDLNRVVFRFDQESGKLYVRGGDTTGRVEMSLDIQYKMPDNRYYTYEYRFTIVNSLYTTEDLPIEIANNADFIDIQNNDTAYDYILTKDLNLYDFTTIANTDKIKSLDGNNHTINIWSYAKTESGTANLALFNQISANTTIKNLTVNLYYLSEIELADAVTSAQVAGFAITNNGVIYNCEVLAYKSSTNTSASTKLGIKMSKDIEATVAGFVVNNLGSITNSRVGGETKLVTSINYIENEEGIVTDRKVIKETVYTKQLAIQASGTVSGFVVNNSGIIASSFVKNVNIQNTYYKQETRVTSGFVNNNTGTITMSYTEGGFATLDEVQSSIGGLEGSGIMSGFVYLNNGTITDSYSNLMITNTRDQVGRLGAGFVFENSESAVIERCYSASKIISNNVTQMNFAGIKDFGGYNNYGTVSNSYYYIKDSADEISIESMLNTQITAITAVNDDKNFYGFSFRTTTNAGTWSLSDHGPQLVSTNDIAHSLRAKVEKPNSVQSELNYVFVYCEGFELGSANNPIIIRDAKEFNSVLGGSNSTEIKQNYNNTKIFGAYRLVNHIDMLELVPEEEQQTEYKVNLLSTKLILTGEFTSSANRNGSLNGNGLTIKNLAISNSSTQSDSFGLFKSVENGATIANLNITLSSGGVTADHTVFVGALAGSLVDSYAYNIRVSVQDTKQSVKVIGANVVGGVFGRVVGLSYTSNISTTNISVTATYNSVSMSGDIETSIELKDNLYNRKSAGFADLSIAGGAFGVVDIYSKEQYEGGMVYAEQALDTNVQSISVTGGFVIEGMSAAGVIGYAGEYVVAKDLSVTITNDIVDTKIIAYSDYAGGVIAYSEGYLYQLKSEHSSEWQKAIESNYNNYYTSENRENIDRGNETLFISDIGYEQKSIGGLIGVVNGGKISIAYSKLNVIANSKYVGGAIGYVSNNYAQTEETALAKNALTLNEIYASGDVYSNHITGFIGGVIGYFNDVGASFTKINAVNYWGEQAYELFASVNTCHNVDTKVNGKQIAAIFNVNQSIESDKLAIDDKGYFDETITLFSLKSVQFINQDKKVFNTLASNSMQGYYDYQGVTTDNGAQVDLMFKENGWYNDGNWSRDTLEALPHIKYINSSNVFEITKKEDFHYFAEYGNDPDVLFVVNGIEREVGGVKTKLIDCAGVQTSYAGFRASIVGATSEDGFENLNITLFKTATNSTISNLQFKNCSAPFVNQSISCKFKNLTYIDCMFTTTTLGSLSGVTNVVSGAGSTFASISFEGCKILGSSATDAGFLFAKTGEGSNTDISITNVKVNPNESTASNSYSIIKDYADEDLNYGLLFGSATCVVTATAIEIPDDMSVIVQNKANTDDGNSTKTHAVNVGLIGGFAKDLTIALSELQVLTTEGDGLQVFGPKLNDDETDLPTSIAFANEVGFNIGGVVGSADTVTATANNGIATLSTEQDARLTVYFAPDITVKYMQSSARLRLGTLCGNVKNLELTGNALFILGQKIDSENNVEFTRLNYDLAEANIEPSEEGATVSSQGLNYVGGVAGSIEQLDVTTGDPYIAYYGDIIAGEVKNSEADTKLALGGLFGTAGKSAGAILKNAFFDGTINFGTSTSKILYLGGIVGVVEGGNSLTVYNTVASGEFVLSKKDEDDNVVDIELVNDEDFVRYAAGLVGFVEGNLTIGNEGETINEKTYYYKTAILTTIYTRKNYDNIDAIANVADSANMNIELVDGVSLGQYSSTLTLCTSKLPHSEEDDLAIATIDGFVENYPYADITGGQTNADKIISCPVFDAIAAATTFNGTKLNPYILTRNSVRTSQGDDILTVTDEHTTTDSMFYAIKQDKHTTLVSKSNRKLYVMVKNDVSWITSQFSLQNTMVFSDGSSIYAGVTPFDIVDCSSAVSGVIAKVYIQTNHDKYTSSGFNALDCYAGFVNSNSGIIYTCSVQETMNETNGMNNSTQFYGFFSNTINVKDDRYTGFAGFAAYNDGYIFGSNANMYFSDNNNLSASGFVANNRESGVIAYSYATGVNYTTRGDLFTPETPAEYLDTDEDFNYWLFGEGSEDKEIDEFWQNVATTDDLYSGNYTEDFMSWGERTYSSSGGTTVSNFEWVYNQLKPNFIQGEDNSQINEQLRDKYRSDIVQSETKSIRQKHIDGKLVSDFLGEYSDCYTIVMAKGKEFSNEIPSSVGQVYGEELSNELILSANNTNLFNATNEESLLINHDDKNYYNCEPDYNWNYPTLSNGAFIHFDFIKRSTLSVGLETPVKGSVDQTEILSYESKQNASKDEIRIAAHSAGFDPSDEDANKSGHEIVRNTTSIDAPINGYFEKVFYIQIPNLTVLKNMQSFITGYTIDSDSTYKYQYSKFVLISDMNFGYNDIDVIEHNSFVPSVNGNLGVGGTDIIIDGCFSKLSNMKLDSNQNFIGSISANSDGSSVYLKKLYIDKITYNGSTGLIDMVGANVNVTDIMFIQSDEASDNLSDIANKDITIEITPPSLSDIELNYFGLIAGKNNGKIYDSSIASTIKTTGSSTNSYVLGGFVGINQGLITDCSFYGQVYIDEKYNTNQLIDVTFGAIAGKNITGTIQNCTIEKGQSNNYYMTEGGSIYKANNETEAVALAEAAGDKLLKQNEKVVVMRTPIYVASTGTAIAGGIVGEHISGTISMCTTYEMGDSAKDLLEDGNYDTASTRFGILVGNEATQMLAYVGGIVGKVEAGYINNTANQMHVSSMAVWQFTTTSTTDYKYLVDEQGNILFNSSNYNKNTVGVSYSDANTDADFRFDNRNKGLLYVYREMTSLAYSGGIAGFGLKNITASENYHLINYGEIYGGYRAVKPVASVEANVENTDKYFEHYTTGTTIYWAGYAIKTTPVPGPWDELIGAAMMIAGMGIQSLAKINAAKAVLNPTFVTTGITGNSLNYYKGVDFVNLFCGGYNSSTVKEKIFNNLGGDDGFNIGAAWNFAVQYKHLLGNNALGAYLTPGVFGKLENDFFDKFTVNYDGKVNNSVSYTDEIVKNATNNKYLQLDNLDLATTIFTDYSYDGICPSIEAKDTNQFNLIYSQYKYFSDTKTPNSGNPENNRLPYNKIGDIAHYTGVELQKDWGEDNWMEDEDTGRYLPMVDLPTIVNPDNNEELGDYQVDGLIAEYTILNPDEWEDVVHTINVRTEQVIETFDEETQNRYNNAYRNAKITLAFKNNQKILLVNDALLNDFDGTITSNLEYDLQNIVLDNKGADSTGLIRKSQKATLKNIVVSGLVEMSDIQAVTNEDGLLNENVSIGLLIGQVYGQAKISLNQIQINLGNLTLDNALLNNVNHFGMLIGYVNTDTNAKDDTTTVNVNIANVDVNTNVSGAASNMKIGNETTDNGFGLTVGKAAKGRVRLDKVVLNSNIEIGSNFNNIGGFVGSVGDSAEVELGKEIDDGNIANITIKALAKANTSVGGAIGFNSGTIKIGKKFVLANNSPLLISADVASFEFFASAGGVIGYNNAGSIEIFNYVTLGIPSYDEENILLADNYLDLGYVFAGYNMVELANVESAFPRKAGTNAGKFIGNDSSRDTTIVVNNIITKFIASDINSLLEFGTYFANKYNASNSVQWTNLLNTIKSVDLGDYTSKAFVDGITINGSQLKSYYKTTYDDAKNGDDSEKSYGDYRLDYKYTFNDKLEMECSDENIDTYEWLLNVNYQRTTREYGVATSKMSDGSNTINISYKFIVRLICTNAKLDDNNVYALQIIKLNDYNVETTVEKTTITLEDIVDENSTQEVEQEAEIFVDTYSVIEDFVPQVIYSMKLNFENYNYDEYTPIVNLEHFLDIEIINKYSKQSSSGGAGSLTQLASSETVQATIKPNNIYLLVQKDGENWNFKIDEKYDVEIDAYKNESSFTHSGEEGAEVGESSTESAGKGSATYTRTLFTQSIVNDKTTSSEIEYTGDKPKYLYSAIVVDGTYNASTNPGRSISFDSSSVDDNENVSLVNSNTLEFIGDFTLNNNSINVVYVAPTYVYEGIECTDVNVFNIGIKGKQYVIASCVTSGEIVEFVYLINSSNKLLSCGNIRYSLIPQSGKSPEEAYSSSVAKRYTSFFPVIDESITSITNIRNNITEPASLEYGFISYTYKYQKVTSIIEAHKFYNKIQNVTETYTSTIHMDYDSVEYTNSAPQKVSTSSESRYQYYTNDYKLSDVVAINEIKMENMLKAEDYTDAQKTLFENSFVRFDANATAPSGAMALVGETFDSSWLKEGERLKYYYVCDSSIVGFVAEYTSLNGSEEEIKWKVYYDQTMHPGSTGDRFVVVSNQSEEEKASVVDPETSETVEKVVGLNCIFYIFDSIMASPKLTVDALN